jgi:hypothetical protein
MLRSSDTLPLHARLRTHACAQLPGSRLPLCEALCTVAIIMLPIKPMAPGDDPAIYPLRHMCMVCFARLFSWSVVSICWYCSVLMMFCCLGFDVCVHRGMISCHPQLADIVLFVLSRLVQYSESRHMYIQAGTDDLGVSSSLLVCLCLLARALVSDNRVAVPWPPG